MDLMQIFAHQDIVLSISFSILVLMSIISWTVIVLRLAQLFWAKKRNKQTLNQFWAAENLAQIKTEIKTDRSYLADVLKTVFEAEERYYLQSLKGLSGQLAFKDYLTLHIRNAVSQTLRKFDAGLTALASIGAVAPFIGLFGTVWGIFNALMNISQQGQVSIATVSAPIGEALVATAMGLFVAIPAVLAYNAISRLNRTLAQDFDAFAQDLYMQLLNQGEK